MRPYTAVVKFYHLVADVVIKLIVHTFLYIRDGSACTTLRRVPGASGKLVDEWMEFYFKKDTEKEFYLRNGQVKIFASICSDNKFTTLTFPEN